MTLEPAAWEFYHNTLYTWILALATGLLVFAGLSLLRRFALPQLRRLIRTTRTDVDDVAAESVSATRTWYLAVVAIWAGSLFLDLPEDVRRIVVRGAALATLAQIGIWGVTAIRAYVTHYTRVKLADDPSSITTVRALGFLGMVLVWVVVVLVALDNLGIEVTAMVAGLGIGGVAVALAVQNILGDLFASLSIVLDKPFVYGDFIAVGDMLGSVEKIGLKTTRLRSLSGEQLVFSNSDLLQSRIRNYKRMFERRVVFNFRIPYGTPPELARQAAEIARRAVEAQEDVRFDRAHFSSFGEWALVYEVVYYVLVPDYTRYMDIQQEINLTIMRDCAEAGIGFAYPTQMLFLEQMSASA
ncbi:MAG TPA: mechanosensitive ion channel family protein [Longimicrobiaceae bacterium]